MGYRRGPVGFPGWTQTVHAMKQARDEKPDDCAVEVMCGECETCRPVDLDALITAKGPTFSLINKRYRCKLTAQCRGWNKFHYQGGVMRPLWTEAQANRWIEIDYRERQRIEAARQFVIEALSGNYLRLDPAPLGVDATAWALADDRERKRLIRNAR
jgi:hypothetical protein